MPSMPRLPKPPGTRMPSKPSSCDFVAAVVGSLGLQPLGLDPGDVELEIVRDGAVGQRLLERLVAVLVLHILADDGDGDMVLGVVAAVDQILPLGQVGRRRVDAQVLENTLLDENQKPTRGQVRDWFQKHHNACRCTGYKPLVDAVMDAARVVRGECKAEDLVFKIPEDGRIWGTSHPRPTAHARVTGTLDYGADLGIKLPREALHLALTQAQVSHAEILSIDTTEAERWPGFSRSSPIRM